jgi:adenine phosphoribosyltransferase
MVEMPLLCQLRLTLGYVSCTLVVIAEKVGADVVEAACVIELPDLKGREKLEGLPLYVLIEKEGL